MNLRVSYNWLKEYIKTNESARDFAKKLSLSGPSVDYISEIKPNFHKVVVGQILKLEKHPQADKLSCCEVDVGEKKPLNIVCGAPNIKVGQKVPVVIVGGKVNDMEIVRAKIRGVESEGMMCSQKELGIGDDHSGIFILPEYVKVGLAFEKVMPIEDNILDIEITANRPDAMSTVGLAREAGAILGDKFLYHEPKPNLKIVGQAQKLSVSVKDTKLCPRYQAIVMSEVKVEASPLWMQQRLLSAGIRPINNLVDITNYVMLEFGQPMHVFDYAKLRGQEIIVRLAKKGEKILALDGKNYELTAETLVIADGANPAAVAGIMGGELSAVSGETKTIVLEAANFNSTAIRKTSRTLNLHSESSNLFEKGLPAEGTAPAILRAIELTMEIAGGKVAAKIMDEGGYKSSAEEILLKEENVKRVLGVEIKKERIKEIMLALGFETKDAKEGIKARVPWWRRKDIEGEHDLIEEIARVYGYHNLPANLMAGEIPMAEKANLEFQLEDKAKDILAALGYSENYNYSFISEKLLKDAGFDPADQVKIANPLSADFEYLRPSLAPGLLISVAENESEFKTIKMFELSRVYRAQGHDLPQENTRLNFLVAENSDEIFGRLKGALQALIAKMNIGNFELQPKKEGESFWQPQAVFEIKVDDKEIGQLGLVDQEALHLFGVKSQVAMAEIDFAALIAVAKASPRYQPLPKLPAIELDLSMEIGQDALYGEVEKAIVGLDPLIEKIEFLSVYQGEKITKGKKALAIRITYRDNEKTLTIPEAQGIHDKVVAKLKKEYNIKVR